jgi:hypothetical protein
MRSHCFGLAAALLLALPAMSAAQDRPADQSKDTQVTLRGCVVPAENDTYMLSNVVEAPGPGGSTMPAVAHGRRIVFWLKDDAEVKQHRNMMVEVSGTFTDLVESEAELKAGAHKDGGLVVEFEGPGRDVRVPNATAGAAVGTAGRQAAETDDVKTYLAEVAVKEVKVVGSSCN